MPDLIFYDNPDEAPLPRAKEAARFLNAVAQPYGDGRRVRLKFELTPCVARPNVDVTVANSFGQEVAALSLIEALDTEFEFTLHLRGPQPYGEHVAQLVLFYTTDLAAPLAQQVIDQREVRFTITPPV